MTTPAHKAEQKRRCDARQGVINWLKDQPCADCGRKYPPYVMDFDHKRDKTANFSGALGRSLEWFLAEISKCEVVCSNCHRERTHGGRA